MVQELETRLGVKPLERTTRSVRLAEAGRYLLTEAREILNKAEVAQHTAKMLDAGTKGVLRVGHRTITGHSLVPEISREFRNANPGIRLDLSYYSSPAQRE